MLLTITDDVTAIIGVATQLQTVVFGTMSALATVVMEHALLLIPVAMILVFTGIKVFKWIF